MIHRIVLMGMLLMTALIMGSCVQETDKYSKKSKEVVVDSAAVKMQALQDTLIALHQQVIEVTAQAEQVSAKCDSVTAENQELFAENNKLKAQLAQARDEVIPAMREQYEGLFTMQQGAYQRLEAKLEVVTSELNSTQSECSIVKADRDRLDRELNQLKPWASKWQKDSKRGFIKVLFGAGKAPVPDIPTPQLE